MIATPWHLLYHKHFPVSEIWNHFMSSILIMLLLKILSLNYNSLYTLPSDIFTNNFALTSLFWSFITLSHLWIQNSSTTINSLHYHLACSLNSTLCLIFIVFPFHWSNYVHIHTFVIYHPTHLCIWIWVRQLQVICLFPLSFMNHINST